MRAAKNVPYPGIWNTGYGTFLRAICNKKLVAGVSGPGPRTIKRKVFLHSRVARLTPRWIWDILGYGTFLCVPDDIYRCVPEVGGHPTGVP